MDNTGLTNNNFKDTSLMTNMLFDPTSILFNSSSFDNDVQISEERLFGDQSFNVGRSQSTFSLDDDVFNDICFLPAVPTAQTSQQQQQQPQQQQQQQYQHQQQQLLLQQLGGLPQASVEHHLQTLQQLQWQQQTQQQSGLQLQNQVQPHSNYDVLQQENQLQQQSQLLKLRQYQLHLQQQLYHRQSQLSFLPQYAESLPAFGKLDTSAVISEPLHAFTPVPQPVRLVQQQQQHILGDITKDSLNNANSNYRLPPLDELSSPEELSPMMEQDGFAMTDEDMCYNPMSGVAASVNLSLERLNVAVNPMALPNGRKAPAVQTIQKIHLLSPTDTPAAPSAPLPQKRQSNSVSNPRAGVRATSPKKKNPKPTAKNEADKSQEPVVKMVCPHDGCKVGCSSIPSLMRHASSHKWRGVYVPVRCEACQSALSNEFSVQRHIKRAQPGSRCCRMRVYSIMKSETEVETTLRFYPERPHGKKTEAVNLAWVKAKYLSASGTTDKSNAKTTTIDD
ncbi:hypothetical protein EDD21DRAFT_408487 [Dissophora ornata]|nr:hypothetical protein EDD21DRAFT_408487 [Dissophora ornata]